MGHSKQNNFTLKFKSVLNWLWTSSVLWTDKAGGAHKMANGVSNKVDGVCTWEFDR